MGVTNTEYVVHITLGNPYDPNAAVKIETQHRDLLDLLQHVINEHYVNWYNKGDDVK